MRELPIIMNTEMVQALLDGLKTQTRRPIKDQAAISYFGYNISFISPDSEHAIWTVYNDDYPEEGSHELKSPYQVGDILYVRETWQYYDWSEDGDPHIKYKADNSTVCHLIEDEETAMKIQDTVWPYLSREENYLKNNRACDYKWRQSNHMPKWAARIHLKVTNVRIERVQDISEGDAIEEGIAQTQGKRWTNYRNKETAWLLPVTSFRTLWDSIYLLKNIGWDQNPYVWAYDFEVMK